MTKFLASIAAALAAASLAVTLWPRHSNTISPVREASQYVQTLARNAGVTILGDKVWSVRKHGYSETVAIRVRYVVQDPWTGARVVGVTTVFVHLLKAGYVVTG